MANQVNESLLVWKLLALDDIELEKVDLVTANLSVACGIESLKSLDITRYCRIVDEWTERFTAWLPRVEGHFRKSPATWHNNLRFFQAGMLQYFLCHEIGLEYKPEERQAVAVQYTDPSDLFLNGLIDTKLGTCGNMAALHVAICRRMGWPVSIACVKNHQLSRFEDGPVVINIECTMKVPGGFSAGSDEDYLKRFKLPKLAQECGSDLRKLSMREMLGVFVNARARHYQDIGRADLCDVECCLARTLLPTHRSLYRMGMMPYIQRGKTLFTPDEVGHPQQLYKDMASTNTPRNPVVVQDGIKVGDMVNQFIRPVPLSKRPPQIVSATLTQQWGSSSKKG